MPTAQHSVPPVRRWPLWLGGILVVIATATLLLVFSNSVSLSGRAATERVLAQQNITRLRGGQSDLYRATGTMALAIVRRDPDLLPRSAGHARKASQLFEGEGGVLKEEAGEWMRRFYQVNSAASSGDWVRADTALTRLAAEQPLTRDVAAAIAREDARWLSADEGMMASDARSRGFALPVAAAGLLLIFAAAMLGYLAAQALRLYGRERRRTTDEERRANALEAAVRERTGDLLEANANLEREIEERSAAEAKLRQGQKMEAIGQLTGGIAHDFNNMLAVVVGGIELAKRRAAEPAQVARHLDRAMEGCERAVALTRRLLSFARAEPANATALSLNSTIEGIADMLERTLGERIAIDLALADALPPVVIDRSQLENAILNLAVNARDAMPDGGTLTLTTARVGSEVEIAVTDTGAGMDDAVRERALEPFFTTKAAGQGTGLGLSQIFGMVTAAKGQMTIDSGVGEGTTIRIRLPASLAATGEVVAFAPPAQAPGPATPRTILVVEDDPRVRRTTISALEELGHRALACSDGSAALALLRGRADVDLIVSDVVMPGLSGPDLARALKRGGLSQPILFVTGYAATEHADVLARHELLRKPFTLAQLAQALTRAQDRVSAPRHAEAGTEAATAPPGSARDAATA